MSLVHILLLLLVHIPWANARALCGPSIHFTFQCIYDIGLEGHSIDQNDLLFYKEKVLIPPQMLCPGTSSLHHDDHV
jgi:hypothetical protein